MAVCAASVLVCPVQAEKLEYRYELKQGKGKPVCEHMTKVFNEKFRAPWIDDYAIQWIPDPSNKYLGESRTVFGKPLRDVFERLPGVEFDEESAFAMLYSKYPESPEFDAVQWREWSSKALGTFSGQPYSIGRLIAEFDIDNDGQKEWVLKHGFMVKRPTNYVSDNGTAEQSGDDELSIFPAGGLDTQAPLSLTQLVYGQKPGYPPRRIGGFGAEVGQMLRPFMVDGRTYLAAYRPQWLKENSRPRQVGVRTCEPDIENMAILEVKTTGQFVGGRVVKTADTEQLCLIRMLPLRQRASISSPPQANLS